MKSREEYEASIFAKRDALLAKRKKNIRITVSALSVMLCLGAAAVAIPMLSEIPDEAALTSVTNAAHGKGSSENKFAIEAEGENGTYPASFDVSQTRSTSDWAEYMNEYANDTYDAIENGEAMQEADELFTMAEEYLAPVTEIALETEFAVEDVAGEYTTGDKQFAYNPTHDIVTPDAETTKPSASKKTYTTEEITSAAKKHLSEGDADKIIDDKTNSVVSRKSDGTTSYTVYFYTAEKKFTVKLNSSLELLEIAEKNNSGGTTQIAPAYNPNA